MAHAHKKASHSKTHSAHKKSGHKKFSSAAHPRNKLGQFVSKKSASKKKR